MVEERDEIRPLSLADQTYSTFPTDGDDGINGARMNIHSNEGDKNEIDDGDNDDADAAQNSPEESSETSGKSDATEDASRPHCGLEKPRSKT